MSNDRKILIYGASGYTGKLVAECLARRGLPFYMCGRTMSRLEQALVIVEERLGGKADAELVAASNTVEELLPVLDGVDVVINVAGPFMQVAWPVVEACLQAGCHYMDTTGEQDWTIAIQEKYGAAFAEKNLLLSPALSYMWCAGALATEVVLADGGVDSIELVYQIDNALPSEASTKSFLRMCANADGQFFLKNNEYQAWVGDRAYTVVVPHRIEPYQALPWGGGCEPVWLKMDDRVQSCKVLTAFGDEIINNVVGVVKRFQEESKGMNEEEKEALTNRYGEEMTPEEPPKDDFETFRTVIVCHGQGQQVTRSFSLSLSAPYTFTGEICAEAAERILNGKLLKTGFQSGAQAFDYREMLQVFSDMGYTNPID